MIILTKIDNSEILINADEIESADSGHDTTITCKSGKKIIVKEKYSEIIQKVINYKKECYINKNSKDIES
jgi:flagellar protein FlbD